MRRALARPNERQTQRAIVTTLQLAGCIVFHVPNGGSRHRVEAARLKADGVVAGTPDLHVVTRAGIAGWLEVKRPGHRPSDTSDEQRAIHAALRERGQRVAIVSSVTEALDAIREWEAA